MAGTHLPVGRHMSSMRRTAASHHLAAYEPDRHRLVADIGISCKCALMKMLGPVLAIILAAGCTPNQSGGTAIDAWESRNSASPEAKDCDEVPTALIRPLPDAARNQGIAMLAHISAVRLTDRDAARLIEVPLDRKASLASTLVAMDLANLNARKQRALVERRDGWSEEDEDQYNSLFGKYKLGRYHNFQPYLVRAVAKNKGTGGFYASICKGDLYVDHNSLGHSVPPSIHVPLVVFLSQPPSKVFVGWTMAE